MVNGPPCARCGAVLRWVPEHAGWTCDRCRAFFPVQAPAPPPQPYGVPPGAPPHPAAAAVAPAKKSSKAVWFGVAGVAVVAAVVVVVVLVVRGGSAGGAGRGSRDELARAAIAALAAGDVDALVALGDPKVMLEQLAECKSAKGEGDDDFDPDKQAKKMREQHAEVAARTKGFAIEIVAITEPDGKKKRIEKGEKMGHECTARVAMTGHDIAVKVKLKKGDAPPVESTIELETVEADGRWYLVDDIEVELPSAVVAEVTAFKDKMCACKDKACADAVMRDFNSWAQTQKDPAPGDTEALSKQVADLMACQEKLAGGVTPPPPTPPTPPPTPTPTADTYAAMIQRMTELKDRTCACKDKACALAAVQAFTEWTNEQMKTMPDVTPDDATLKQMTAVGEAYKECASRLSGAATSPPSGFAVGDRVMARWTNGSWYPGKIAQIHPDGTIDVDYDDGDKSRNLPPSKVRKKKASSGGGKSSSGSSSDAPCPGPGLTRRCNGKCVNIQEDNNHCGGCNNRCPDGKHCDGHMFCRDAEGNL